ncbi:MAG: signal peptidase I [Spongiibacteraceae bacterium]|jgi:signal peptidase I|nr:signal peptidase I [Spongiibacteraceae bacterium]
MVNTLLWLVCGASLVIWLVQELVGRRAALQAGAGASLPAWCGWSYQLVALAWAGWLAAALILKDGDFALVLVLLTLLAAVIGALDKWLFEPRRRAAAEAHNAPEELIAQLDIAEYARSFFPVLVVVLVLRSFIVEPFQIPSSSMEPTLEVGDYILVNKFTYGVRLPVLGTKILDVGEPRRGDVMVFFPPNDDRYFIKRVIGLPGDTLRYHDKQLTINGEPAPQQLIAVLPPMRPVYELESEQLGPVEHMIKKDLRIDRGDFSVTVESGHYFMMGDNRDNSSDSRVWGQVPEARVVGRAFAIWMHWGSFTELPSFSRVGAIQ